MPHEHAEATLFVDGASFGNPGPAGAGYVLVDGGRPVAQAAIPLGVTTNNVAEYHGLIHGLAEAIRRGYRRLRVVSDSELLCKQLRGEYRVKAKHLKPLYERALQLMSSLDEVAVEHRPREDNREADKLAKKAARSAARGRG